MTRGASATAVAVCALAGCLPPSNLEQMSFACHKPADCVAGFGCDLSKKVCVRIDADGAVISFDAALSDAGSADAALADAEPDAGHPALGKRCTDNLACGGDRCVDGVCCENACNGTCVRCDRSPGRCLPIADGQDPDLECANLQLSCAGLTYGLIDASCYALAEAPTTGTCDGAGACRPNLAGCPATAQPGLMLSRCRAAGCLRLDTCPRGVPVSRYDETSELCTLGQSCTAGTFSGCCSPTGGCCPAPMCTDGALCG